MQVNEGYTWVPSVVIKEEMIKNLNSKEYRTLITLYHCMNFNEHGGSRLTGFRDMVVTTLTKLKALLGYSKSNLSIDDLKIILKKLEDSLAIKNLEIEEDGKVSAKLEHYSKGKIFIYNNRLMKGSERLKDGDLKVFLLLLTYGKHEKIKITYNYMAKWLGVNVDTVRNNINSLVKKGLITKFYGNTYDGGKKRTHLTYTMLEKVDFNKIDAIKEAERKQALPEICDEVF